MTLSKHARTRMRQRGFTYEQFQLMLRYGSERRRPGRADEYFVDNKAVSLAETHEDRKQLEELKGASIISKGGEVLTVQHTNKRFLRDHSNRRAKHHKASDFGRYKYTPRGERYQK